MKRFSIVVICTCFLCLPSRSQNLTISEVLKKDGREMDFEILGKFSGNFLVYKNITRQSYITRYDKDMKILETIRLDFVPPKTFNADFIVYPDYFYMLYQYQKASVVYCYGVKMDANGKKLTEPKLLDTTSIGFFAENKIYSTVYSENRKNILLYKKNIKNDRLTLATKLFNDEFDLLDSTRQYFRYDDRREIYSDLYVDNFGSFVYAKETKKSAWDNSNGLEVYVRAHGVDTFKRYDISLQKKYIEDVNIKIDNLNKNFIVNAFYYNTRRSGVSGLFSAVISMEAFEPLKVAFNVFSDSLRVKINSSESFKFVFDNLVARNVIVKKDGGFIIAAEDFYTETLYSNAWNRNYFYNTNPYYSASDYYLSSPYYNGYRSYNNYRDQNIRYYYDDIVVASLDSNLKLQWNDIIHKKQYDIETDNFLSYSIMNSGGELHFLFIGKATRNEIVNNHAVTPGGEIKRYPTLKSNERGYEFMPRLAKQVGASQVIMPFVYLNRVGFAKIDF